MPVIVEAPVMPVPLTPMPTKRPVAFGTVMVVELMGICATVRLSTCCGVRVMVRLPVLRTTERAPAPPDQRLMAPLKVAPLLTIGELIVTVFASRLGDRGWMPC